MTPQEYISIKIAIRQATEKVLEEHGLSMYKWIKAEKEVLDQMPKDGIEQDGFRLTVKEKQIIKGKPIGQVSKSLEFHKIQE